MIKKYNYTSVTETPDTKASREQLTRLFTRYRFASGFCNGKDVLEVACGAGQGLAYLAKNAKRVIGGDIDENNLKFAWEHYKYIKTVKLIVFDAHNLPFDDNTFDVVILYEAIYYLENPEKFISEARRGLSEGGMIIICTANKDVHGFNPSPYSYKYLSAPDLFNLLKKNGFIKIALYGDSPVTTGNIKDIIVSLIKRMAIALHLIPKTMKGKEFLKRIFMGKLSQIPSEIYNGMAKYIPPSPISHDIQNFEHKVLFVVGYK